MPSFVESGSIAKREREGDYVDTVQPDEVDDV